MNETALAFDRAATQYRETGLRTDEETLVHIFFPPAPARVLVVGCGTGRTVFPLLDRGYDAHGIDIAPNMIRLAQEQARQTHPSASFDVADAAEIGSRYAPGSFDVVWFPWHALDYVTPESARQDALDGAAMILAPGGLCVFSTHNRLFPRVLPQYLKTAKGPYATINSSEGGLFTYTSLPWSAGSPARPFFSQVKTMARYRLIPPHHPKWKERLARITAPLLDKSLYVICRNPIQKRSFERATEIQPAIRSSAA